MNIEINGEVYEIQFKYSVIRAIAEKLKLGKLADVQNIAQKIGFSNAHLAAKIAINETLKKKDSDLKKVTDTDILDAWDEDDNGAGNFIRGFTEALTKSLSPDVTDEVASGN